MSDHFGEDCCRPGGREYRAAHTLVEMVVAVAIVSVVVTAVGSSILLAGKAIPDADNPASASLAAAGIANQIATELCLAVSLKARSATMIEFTVQRHGLEHTIRYEWSGSPGDPLIRRFDQSPAANAVDSVQEFSLACDMRAAKPPPPSQVEGPEQLLSSYEGAAGPFAKKIEKDKWWGQYFAPVLPGDAASWRVTRVLFKATKDNKAAEETLVQLCPADPFNKPTPIVLEEHVMYEINLTQQMTWQEFSFSNVAGLPPGQGLCLVLRHTGVGGPSANVEIDTAGSGCLEATNTGLNWIYHADQSLQYYVYGKVTKITTPPPPTDGKVVAVTVTLNVGSGPSSRIRTGAMLLNQPEVASL